MVSGSSPFLERPQPEEQICPRVSVASSAGAASARWGDPWLLWVSVPDWWGGWRSSFLGEDRRTWRVCVCLREGEGRSLPVNSNQVPCVCPNEILRPGLRKFSFSPRENEKEIQCFLFSSWLGTSPPSPSNSLTSLQSDRLPRPSLGQQFPFFAQVAEPLNEESSVLVGVFTLKPLVHSRWSGWDTFHPYPQQPSGPEIWGA